MRLHAVLLRLYPRSFRLSYGADLQRQFQRRRDAAVGMAVAGVWASEIADIISNAARLHADLLRQDVRQTLRSLWRARGFAAAVIVVTALGVGATTAVFSVADHVLLRPLPYAEPDRLVKIWHRTDLYSRLEVSPPNFVDWQRETTSFSEMAAFTAATMNLTGAGEPTVLTAAFVSANLFDLLGATPLHGRRFLETENRPGRASVAILSERLWRGTFGADPAMIGRSIVLNNQAWTVVGIMPAAFRYPSRLIDVWIPLLPPESLSEPRDSWSLQVVARLKPGYTRERASADVQAVQARLTQQYPENRGVGATLIGLRDEVAPQGRMLLYVLLGATVGILLIACTNLASLLLARSSARERELAVRLALGAGRERLLRQFLTESTMLAGVGGALGVLIAVNVTPLIVRLVPTQLPIAELPGFDARVLFVALMATLVTGVSFGIWPVLRNSRDAGALRDGQRAGTSRHTARARAILVVVQVAASVVLLVGTGLFGRALLTVRSVDPGFKTDAVLTLRTTLPTSKYALHAPRVAFYRTVLDELDAVPGVTAAAYASWIPMTMRGGIWPVFLPGEAREGAGRRSVSLRYITPEYFTAMRVPLLLGRAFDERDTLNAQYTAIVSASLAEQLWPGEDPRGKQFFTAFADRTIVGVAGDVRVRGLERESEPQVYLPYQQQPDSMLLFYSPKDLIVRLESDAHAPAVTRAVRSIIAKADAEQPVAAVQMLADVVDADTAIRASQARVLAGFAAVASLLAMIGLHGLLAYLVSMSSREIGVRLALGATPGEVLRMVAGRGLRLSLAGILVGIAVAMLGASALRAVLAGIQPADAITLAGTVALALAATIVGSLSPALRAARTSPTEALRAE